MASNNDGEQTQDDLLRQVMIDVMRGKLPLDTPIPATKLQHVNNAQSLLTLAHLGVEKGNVGVLRQLMPYLRRQDVYNEEELNILLHKSVRSNQLHVVETIINNGGDVNSSVNGKPLLHVAAVNGNVEIVNALLGAGAARDILDKKGDTAVHVVLNSPSTLLNKDTMALALLKWETNTSLPGSNGKYLVHTAATTSPATLALLLKTGHDVNTRDVINADTPLHAACNMACHESILVLIKHGCHFNLLNQHGQTPLARLLRGINNFNDFHGKSRLKLAKRLVSIGFKMYPETKRISGKVKQAKGRDKAYDKYTDIVRSSSKVHSLQELARCTVLSSLQSGRHVRAQIQSLHIPSQIMSFIMFDDISEL